MSTEQQSPVPVVSCAPGEGADITAGQEDSDAGKMSLGDHISELRGRIVATLLVFGVVFIAGLCFYRELYNIARLPLLWTASSMGKTPDSLVKFQGLGPLDGFLWIVRIDLFFSLIIALPMMAYQIWLFVVPGMLPGERRALRSIFSAGSALFLCGVAVAFCLAVPMALQFLLRFGETLPGFENRWTGQDYMSFVIMCCLGFGACFETPMVMLALAKAGLITPRGILKYWRHSALVMVVLGAVFTPPDPMTQVLLAGMMMVLFFAGYFLVKWVSPENKEE